MITKVDWISFSFPCYVADNDTREQTFSTVNTFAQHQFGMTIWDQDNSAEWELGAGRAPFAMSFFNRRLNTTVFVGSGAKIALVEISGQGCERLRETDDLHPLLVAVQDRVTRLDIACDLLTDLTPMQFVGAGYSPRFKSHSEFTSDSGSTFYIGSRTSDRYCRVYRYNPPHERAHLLRIEYVFKGEEAKATAGALCLDTVEACARAAGDAFVWKHPQWTPQAPTAAEIKAYRPERHEGKTLFWLNDTIAPLLIRLHTEGILDVRAWTADILAHLTEMYIDD